LAKFGALSQYLSGDRRKPPRNLLRISVCWPRFDHGPLNTKRRATQSSLMLRGREIGYDLCLVLTYLSPYYTLTDLALLSCP
jgi:hypothetical protein